MTDVIVAKTAGFCFGVTKAVEKVYQQAEEGITPIYTYGPIFIMKKWLLIWREKAFA